MLKRNLVAASHANCELIQKAVKECEANARNIYGDAAVSKITTLFIDFFDKGRDAAMAAVGKDKFTGSMVGVLQFSMFSTIRNIKRMLSEIVPHEYAHILCMANGWDDGHGENWKQVCIDLGGNGETHHNFATVDGRMKNLYEARCDEGQTYWLTGKQVRMAKATGIEVRDAVGRNLTLTKCNITGKVKKL